MNPLTKFIRGYSKEDVTTALILRSICTGPLSTCAHGNSFLCLVGKHRKNSNDCSNEGLSYIAGYSGSLKTSTHIWETEE
ncbi:Hypothetical protein FKW44_015538 [Caligus rogercresseyi]|uniref:Uncharacterized protein n=1 Tax=Caligus rogercresseyi TaxID=217165 RepID=A0A7T8H148_CALRO|nr:Hypothetical protein FKW44_015538 [Caligus rogercresseyi]